MFVSIYKNDQDHHSLRDWWYRETDDTERLMILRDWRYREADDTERLTIPRDWRYREIDDTERLTIPRDWWYRETDDTERLLITRDWWYWETDDTGALWRIVDNFSGWLCGFFFCFKLCVEELSVPTVIKDKGCNMPVSDLTLENYIFSTQCVYCFGMFCLQKP